MLMELYVIARDLMWRSKQAPKTPLAQRIVEQCPKLFSHFSERNSSKRYPQIRPAVGFLTETNVRIKSTDMEFINWSTKISNKRNDSQAFVHFTFVQFHINSL